jgi:hypothetical protein
LPDDPLWIVESGEREVYQVALLLTAALLVAADR